MTCDPLSDLTVTSGEEFEAVLAAAIEQATGAGVDIRGAWEFESRGSIHDWEVEILELARKPDDEDEW